MSPHSRLVLRESGNGTQRRQSPKDVVQKKDGLQGRSGVKRLMYCRLLDESKVSSFTGAGPCVVVTVTAAFNPRMK